MAIRDSLLVAENIYMIESLVARWGNAESINLYQSTYKDYKVCNGANTVNKVTGDDGQLKWLTMG